MLTAKENMRRCIMGDAAPDRFVNNFEALAMGVHPAMMVDHNPQKGEMNVVNNWGITRSFPANTPGAFPVHTPELIVVKDIEHWQDYVHAPSTDFPEPVWEAAQGMYAAMDGEKAYKTVLYVSGLFEMTHHLCSIDQALIYYMTNPDEMADMIEYLKEYELRIAEGICSRIHPEALFHHDDWGSETNSFLRPSMFEDFFVDAYKEIYKYYHDHGVQLIFHHADSYCVNLVDDMIEMGIDVWQGCMQSNNVPELVKKYKGKITFMGDIDNKSMDFPGWTKEDCRKAAVRAMEENGMYSFIPCITQGGPGSVFSGSYQALSDEIDKYNAEKFGFTVEEIAAQRPPLQIMFG